MAKYEQLDVRYTISNASLPWRLALFGGINETAQHLHQAGILGGVAWLSLLRTRLYAEMFARIQLGNFTNTIAVKDMDGQPASVTLIGSMEQSFAPTVPEAVGRYRKRKGDMPTSERAARLASNLFWQRLMMAPVLPSLLPMRAVAHAANNPRMFASLYSEELPPGKRYNDHNAPYKRISQLSPDMLTKLGTSVKALPEVLAPKGIQAFAFNTYHAARTSQYGPEMLGPSEEYLPDFASRGLIRQFMVSLNRTDLPASTGIGAMQGTFDIAKELSQEPHKVDPRNLGELPRQLECVIGNSPPDAQLDITVTGNAGALSPERLHNVYANLMQLAQR